MAFWPQPRECRLGGSVLWLSPDPELKVAKSWSTDCQEAWYQDLISTGEYEESSPRQLTLTAYMSHSRPHIQKHSKTKSIHAPHDILETAFARMKNKIFRQNFIPYKMYPKRVQFEPDLPEHRIMITRVLIRLPRGSPPARVSPEAYQINMDARGLVCINTFSHNGAIHALDTFAQAFYIHSRSKQPYTSLAPLEIKDAPFFEHRGLNLDISRNWIPPKDVLRTIEPMGFNKLNRLHLHASDSQSWPLEIPSLPTLAKEGAYREDQVWTAKDLEKIQLHGIYHGVEVYLEIDMPGHTGAIVHAFPDLITAYDQRPWNKWAAEPPSGQLRLNSPDVRSFLETLLGDLLPRVRRFSERFHLGGDELNTSAYTLDPTVHSSDREVIKPLLQKFFDHVVGLVEAEGMTPYVWQEMLLDWDLKFPESTVFQAWRPGALALILSKNHRALFGASTSWYLDTGHGTFLDPAPSNPSSPIKPPYPDWCPPYKNWRQILDYDPLADIPKHQHHLVLGGEVHLWGELTDGVNLDPMLWPRAAAAAEMMWQGKGEVCESTTRRLAEMRERLLGMGVAAGVVQMEWGLRNRGGCVL